MDSKIDTRPPAPPCAARRETVAERFGRRIVDAYGWLRDPDWQRVMREPEALQPEIRAQLEAENAYTEAVLAPVAGLRETLFAELKARIKQDDSSVPAPDGGWAYYTRYEEGGQYPILCRRPSDDADGAREQILLDGNREAEGQSFFSIHGAAHAPDHRLFASAIDSNGSEYCTIRIRDTETGGMLPDRLENALGDIAWANDGRTFFYTILDDHHRPYRVLRHHVGEPAESDVVIYEDTHPGFYLSIGRTESGRYITIDAHDHSDTTEVRLIDADRPDEAPVLIAERRAGISYEVSDHGERLLVLTNDAEAEDFKIAEAPIATPGPANWKDLVAHRPGCLLLSMLLFEDYLVRLERVDALPRIVVRRLADGEEHEIAFDEEAYALSLMPGYEFRTATLRFSYSSPTTPQRVFDYDMATRTRTLRKQQEIPSGHDPDAYVCRRLLAPGHDGARVPVTVLYRKDTRLDGSAPLLLYGYGAYGISIPAAFSPNLFSLVDRGFVYALAHIRGGTDCGYRWYLDGKMTHKTNTFRDFIAAAEHLIAERFTAAGRIVAMGRSAGGLLMGAVANMRPDLFGGIIAEVPFVDVLNTMLDETLPLTPPEWVEWGDPIHDADAFAEIASYCPYTNVSDRPYPAVLATGGLTDPRVTYWEPAKWAAKLRHHTTGDRPILCWINLEAGHGGASGRFDRLEEVAMSYGFALMVAGKG